MVTLFTTNEALEKLGIRNRQTLMLWLERHKQLRPKATTSTRGDLGWTAEEIEAVRVARLASRQTMGRPKTRV